MNGSAQTTEATVFGRFVVALSEGAALFVATESLLLLVFGHTENIEFVLYLLAFAVILPLTFASSSWRRRWLSARELSALASIDAAALAAALAVGRLAQAGPRPMLLAGVLVLALGEVLAGPMEAVLSNGSRLFGSDALAVLLLFAAGLTLLPSRSYHSTGFWLAFPVAAGIALLGPWLLRPRPFRPWVDAVAAVLILGWVMDISFWGPLQVDNQNYFLGPVNQVLHGGTMLVDTFAQYGVGVMYFLAGVFLLVPIGYGTFALVIAALAVIEVLLIYAIVRICGRSQVIPVIAAAVAVVFVQFGQLYSAVPFPSAGLLRFGPPYIVILLEVLAARNPARRQRLQRAAVATTAIVSLWSFEAFSYTLATFLAILGLELVIDRERWREILRARISALAGLVVAVQLLFAVGTRLASGHAPDWKIYLEYIRLYSVKGFYNLPVTPWSPGFLEGALCFASALLLAVLAVHRSDVVRAQKELFVGLSGSTAFAILAYTYYVGRSHPNNIREVAPPLIVVCALWLCLLTDGHALRRSTALRYALIAVAGWSSFMLVGGSLQQLRQKWTHTVFGALIAHDPDSVRTDIRFLAGRPEFDPQEDEGVALLRQFDPGSSHSLVLVDPELTTAILIRAGRGNALPIATPPQDIVLPAAVSRELAAVPALRTGTVMLTETSYLTAPNSDPAAPLTELAVWRVRQYFTLTTLDQTADGLAVVRLG